MNSTVGSTVIPLLVTDCAVVTEATGPAVLAALSGWRRATASSAHASGESTGTSGSLSAPSDSPLSASERKPATSPAGAGSGSGVGTVATTTSAAAGGAEWVEGAWTTLAVGTLGAATAAAVGTGTTAGVGSTSTSRAEDCPPETGGAEGSAAESERELRCWRAPIRAGAALGACAAALRPRDAD